MVEVQLAIRCYHVIKYYTQYEKFGLPPVLHVDSSHCVSTSHLALPLRGHREEITLLQQPHAQPLTVHAGKQACLLLLLFSFSIPYYYSYRRVTDLGAAPRLACLSSWCGHHQCEEQPWGRWRPSVSSRSSVTCARRPWPFKKLHVFASWCVNIKKADDAVM